MPYSLRLTRENTQLIVALVITGLWAVAVIVAIFDGALMAKVMTPMMTSVLGWLFTAEATTP